jgi:flagellar protein FlbD
VIRVTRLNHLPMVLNSDLIENIETTPDTVVTLTNGSKVVVLESADEILERVVCFRRSLYARLFDCPLAGNGNKDGSSA